ENLELRLGTFYNMYKAEDYFYDMLYEVNGTGPLSSGLKMPVYKGEKLVPSVSFLAELGLPYLANEDFRPDDFIPRMSVLFSNKLNDKISLGCNVGADWSDYARKTVGFYSLIIGYGFSDKLSVFAEGYGSFVVDEDADNRLDAGLSFLILPNFQIDAYGGIGLADMSDIYFIAGGLTYRIPE
ncbi:MAG: transporter, partial [Bacteroidota bacterium]